jgi:hypothetical protein
MANQACQQCHVTSLTHQCCASCRDAWYCNRDCQRRDWPWHRVECRMKRVMENAPDDAIQSMRRRIMAIVPADEKEPVRFVPYESTTIQRAIGCDSTSNMTLSGYGVFRFLAMFTSTDNEKSPVNVRATRWVAGQTKKTWEHRDEMTVRGNVVMIDDVIDMTQQRWDDVESKIVEQSRAPHTASADVLARRTKQRVLDIFDIDSKSK